MSEAPKRIWLQRPFVDDEASFNEDITWCADQINDDDTEYVRADEIERKDAAIAELVEAGQAVVDRWDSPLWKDQPHTGEFIARLRDAIAKHTGERNG